MATKVNGFSFTLAKRLLFIFNLLIIFLIKMEGLGCVRILGEQLIFTG
jgi:hypothetical protein